MSQPFVIVTDLVLKGTRLTHFRQWVAADEFPSLAYCGLNSTS
jgi:hypothetical protein